MNIAKQFFKYLSIIYNTYQKENDSRHSSYPLQSYILTLGKGFGSLMCIPPTSMMPGRYGLDIPIAL